MLFPEEQAVRNTLIMMEKLASRREEGNDKVTGDNGKDEDWSSTLVS